MKSISPILSFAPAVLISVFAFMVISAVPLSKLLLAFSTSVFGFVLFIQVLTKIFQHNCTKHSLLSVILAHLAPFWSFGGLVFTLLKMDGPISNNQILVGLATASLAFFIIVKPSRGYLKTNHFLRTTAWVSVITLLLIVLIRISMRFL
jgi:hypothetical protein